VLEAARMRFALVFGLIALLAATSANAPGTVSTLFFKPIALDRDHPDRRDFGRLTLLGAWRLTSDNLRFGGISSMRVIGNSITMLSDSADVFQFAFDGKSRRAALHAWPLPGRTIIDGESEIDAESMTVDPVSGAIWVGFERTNSIQRFSPDLKRRTGRVAPLAMAHWPGNAGPEGMARLPDGRFVVFSEKAFGGAIKGTEALVFAGDPILHPRPSTRFYRKFYNRYRVTEAAMLPDGRILTLNRHGSLTQQIGASLLLIDPADIGPDQRVFAKWMQRLEPPLTIDNMEALAVEQRGGKTIIWMASDNNHSPFQQTLLFKFTLRDAGDN